MGSHDTGIYLNTNSTESSGVRRRHPTVELLPADIISPVCEPSEISPPIDADDADAQRPRHNARAWKSFEKTSTWLLQQDSCQAVATKESEVGLERATRSNISVGSKYFNADLTPTITASHSEPALLQNAPVVDNDVSMARSSVTIIAPVPSGQAFVDGNPTSCISPPACQNSSRQKTRQLRFSCAVSAAEDCPDSKDCTDIGRHTASARNTVIDTEDADGEQWVTYGSRNDAEELSMEDGASVANSNTSLSDTCNSSFKSSTEDLANHGAEYPNENSTAGVSNGADVTPRVSSPRCQHSPGLRHRKRRPVNDGQRLHSLSPARLCDHMRLADDREEDHKTCHECDSLVLDSAGGLWLSTDAAAAAVVGETPRVEVSSDDDDDNGSQLAPHTSPSKSRLLHARHSRRPCSSRAMRSNDKCPPHSPAADVLSKDWSSRAEGWRTNVRIMDVRLLESTGISSADSDAEAARISANKSASPMKASNHVFCILPPGRFVSNFSCFGMHVVC